MSSVMSHALFWGVGVGGATFKLGVVCTLLKILCIQCMCLKVQFSLLPPFSFFYMFTSMSNQLQTNVSP